MVGKTISHYRVLATLGKGGMGVVYKAEDTRLGRTVALKFLPDFLAGDRVSIERFQREARAVSALNHPNICTLYDIDQTSNTPFLVMECMEGRDLRERIQAGPLKLDEVLNFALQIVDALDAAHSRGVVHRDIKPANIFITTRGQAKIMDFGLAKVTSAPPSDTGSSAGSLPAIDQLTDPGLAIGTVAYMSPEQARGEELDARTDIFSFGVVFYEMLTGVSPFLGTTTALTYVSILHNDPKPPGAIRPDTPNELERIITKALAKSRDARYKTAADLHQDLKRLRRMVDVGFSMETRPIEIKKPKRWRLWGAMAAGVLLLALAVTFVLYNVYKDKPLDSLAVLPFANTGADPTAEYLSDGITEGITNSLSQSSTLSVRPFSSSIQYKKKDISAVDAGRGLGVSAVLTGRLAARGGNLDISAELIDVRGNRQIWGSHYSRPKADLQSLQREIAHTISDKLKAQGTGEQKERLARRATPNPEAYQLYLQGRYQWNKRTLDGIEQSIEDFQAAIRKDPNYALAWAGQADAYALLADFNILPGKEVLPKLQAAAVKALQLDESLAEAHTSLAWAQFHAWEWAGAEKEFHRAIELDPRYATAHLWHGEYLMAQGRFDEALTEMTAAQQLDPLSPAINLALGYRFYYAHQYVSAIDQYQKAIAADPAFGYVHLYLGSAYEQQGSKALAIEEFRHALELSGGNSNELAALGHAYAIARKMPEARKILVELKERSRQTYVQPLWLAAIHLALDERDLAHDWIDKAYEDRSSWLVYLKVDPIFDRLRAEPWFKDLLRRIGP
jgi:eukaryotic-like serine/threonine-protein kinase